MDAEMMKILLAGDRRALLDKQMRATTRRLRNLN
jgi:hypothetical protein